METIDTANIAENMIIEDDVPVQNEVTAEELTENLPTEPKTEAKPAEPKSEEPPKSPEKTRKDVIGEGLTSLMEEGVTSEELLAFSQDEAARKDIQAGKDVVRAFMAYSRRQASAAKPEQNAAPKPSIPTVKTQTTTATGERSSIKDMSKKEFAEFSRRAEEAARMGKKVTFK